jgi:hypothetical protein
MGRLGRRELAELLLHARPRLVHVARLGRECECQVDVRPRALEVALAAALEMKFAEPQLRDGA